MFFEFRWILDGHGTILSPFCHHFATPQEDWRCLLAVFASQTACPSGIRRESRSFRHPTCPGFPVISNYILIYPFISPIFGKCMATPSCQWNERCSPTGLSFARWIAESEGKKSRTPDWLEKTRVSCRFSQQSTPDWSWMDCSAVWCSLRLMRSSNKANLGRRRNELDDGFDQPQRCPKIDKKLGDIGSSNNPVSTVFLSFEGKPFCCEDQTHSFNKPYAPRNRQLKLVMTNT